MNLETGDVHNNNNNFIKSINAIRIGKYAKIFLLHDCTNNSATNKSRNV
jgi:hypothetical protein